MPDSVPDVVDRRGSCRHARRRCWPAVVSVDPGRRVTMGYSLSGIPVVHHTQIWIIPGDIWSTFRAAHWVGWGNIGGIYGSDTQLVTFPGIAVLLAPVAMISGASRTRRIHLPHLPQPARRRGWSSDRPSLCLVARPASWRSTPWPRSSGSTSRRRVVLAAWRRSSSSRCGHVGSSRGRAGVDPRPVRTVGRVPRPVVPVRLALGGRHRGAAAGHPHGPAGLRPIAHDGTACGLCLLGALPLGRRCSAPRWPCSGSRPPAVLFHQANFQVPRSCDTVDRPVAHADPDQRSAPDPDGMLVRLAVVDRPRAVGIRRPTVDGRPALAVRAGPQPAVLLRVGDGPLLPGTAAGADRPAAALRWQPDPAGRGVVVAMLATVVRLPPVLASGATGPRWWCCWPSDWPSGWPGLEEVGIRRWPDPAMTPQWPPATGRRVNEATGASGVGAGDRLTAGGRGAPSAGVPAAQAPRYSGPTVCFRPGSTSRAVARVGRASATTARVAAGSITASTNPRSEAW